MILLFPENKFVSGLCTTPIDILRIFENENPALMQNKSSRQNFTAAFVSLTFLFFMWGFMTVLNDILIPYLKDAFRLNHTRAMLVQFAFFTAYFVGSLVYFVVSVVHGDPINRLGYKKGIIAGLVVSAAGALLFYPAAQFHIYGFFLTALFVMGLGFTLLQIAANPYVAILGPSRSASARLNLAQGFNSLGTTIAPVFGGFLIFTFFKEAQGSDAVKIPYLAFALVFLLLAGFIKLTPLPRFTNPGEVAPGFGALRYRQLVLGMVAIFMYVGGEVSIGSILISYLNLPEIGGLDKAGASVFVSIYWGGQMTGRFLGAVSLSKMKNRHLKTLLMAAVSLTAFVAVGLTAGWDKAQVYGLFLLLNLLAFFLGKSMPHRTLFIFAFINLLLLITTLTGSGAVALWTVVAVGLFNSIMWSNIFTLAIDGLGKYTSQGSSLLVMMILGGAILPVLMGMVADSFGVQMSFVIPVFSYLYIAFYGLKGFQFKRFNT
ncbi:MAG: sugar MFS transporter [Bacteroidales bacterium]|nr:sugar MFS transporter [Bacteroidales bacterium]